MQRRRFFYSLLFVALAFVNIAWGQSTPLLRMTPAAQQANVGTEFNVTIRVENIPGPPGQELRGCKLNIAFDPLLLQAVSLTEGTFLSSFGSLLTMVKKFNNTTGLVEYETAILGNGALAVGSGDLLIIRFRSIASGTVDLNFTEHLLRDRDNYNIAHDTEKGTIYSGSANLYVHPNHTSVDKVGDTFTIQVNIDNVFNMKGAGVYLQYDPLRIEVVSTALGNFFSSRGFSTFPTFNTSTAGLVIYNESVLNPPGVGGHGAGTLFNVTFRAKTNGYGMLTFDTDVNSTRLRDPENTPIPYTFNNGSYEIGPIAVVLLSFSAAATDEGVLLCWSVADEIGVAGYNLSRTDMEAKSNCRVNSELIPACSLGISVQFYQYIDIPPKNGEYLYTLQQVANDGMVSNSEPISVFYSNQSGTESVEAKVYDLFYNYPNPFNACTVIRFDLKQDDHVRLAIYDALGKQVIVPVDADLHRGAHEVVWNGSDENGNSVSSGVYLVRLTAGTTERVGIMSLLK